MGEKAESGRKGRKLKRGERLKGLGSPQKARKGTKGEFKPLICTNLWLRESVLNILRYLGYGFPQQVILG